MTTTKTHAGPLETTSYRFALDITLLCKDLMERKREYVLSKQLLRSGTSVGANIQEAQFAQSRADFVCKFSIALKEANESRYWLRLLCDTGYVQKSEISDLFTQVQQIIGMLVRSIKTTKNI